MNKKTVQVFVNAINDADLSAMYFLMADDHLFIDAQGNAINGRDKMNAGWKAYFEMFPDYTIELTEIYEHENVLIACGFAGGTFHAVLNKEGSNSWRLPAAWKVTVENEKIKSWQVFADTKIPFEIIQRNSIKKNGGKKRVTSIGGIFFKCKDPDKVKDWYKKHLGLNTDQYGTSFEWRHADNPYAKGFSQWSPFKESTDYFEPSTKEFMINYRVEDLSGLVGQLKKEGVTVTDEIQSFEYGKFVHILDVEGNKIELWEPDDIEFEKVIIGSTW
jgi:predicted enzyme related to lactoylglutathione lyase/ketosteroid isomerase-like protein